MREHIVAVFDSERPAMEAVQELEQAGIPSTAIRQFGSGNGAEGGSSARGGFWAWLLGDGGAESSSAQEAHPDEAIYHRHVAAGRSVLSITVEDDSKIHDAITILDAHRPVEVEESTEDAGDSEAETAVPGLEADGRTSVSPTGTDFSTAEVVRPADVMGAGTDRANRIRRYDGTGRVDTGRVDTGRA